MRVDARATYDPDSDAPTRRADLDTREANLSVLLTELDEEHAQITAGAPTCLRAGRSPAASRQAEQPGTWPTDELEISIEHGEKGDPASARRAAELLELINDYKGAVAWWHRAADLGDEDAIDYVRVILAG